MTNKTKDLFVSKPPVATLADSAVYKFPDNTDPPTFVFRQTAMNVVQGAYVLRHSTATNVLKKEKADSVITTLSKDKSALVTHGRKQVLLLPDVKTIEEELKNAVDLYAHAKKNKIDFVEGADVLSSVIPHTVTVMAHYFAALSAGIKKITFNKIEKQHSSLINDFIQDNWPIFSGLKNTDEVLTYLNGIKNDTPQGNQFFVPKSDRLLEEINKLDPKSDGFKKAFVEIARRESKKITSALASAISDADTDKIGIFWFSPASRKYEFKEPSIPTILMIKLTNEQIREYFQNQPDYRIILASFVGYFFIKEDIENATRMTQLLRASPSNADQTENAINILNNFNVIYNQIFREQNKQIISIINEFKSQKKGTYGSTAEESRVLELLAKTQTAAMDGPIKDLLREIVTRFQGATLEPDGVSVLDSVKEYLAWLDGDKVGDIPKSEWSVAFKATSILLLDEKTKEHGLVSLVERLDSLQQNLNDSLAESETPVAVIDYRKAMKSVSGDHNQVLEKAWREAQSLVDKREMPDKRPETVVGPGAIERMGNAIGKAAENVVGRTASTFGRQVARIPGAPTVGRLAAPVGRLAVAPVNAASAAVDAAMSTRVGRSAVCDKDAENLSDLQIMLRSAIQHADSYLVTQYKMFGMWAVFNLALIGVIVYFLYRIFRAVLSYVQMVRELNKKRETTKSNDIFNPADDNDHYPVDPKLIAKNRIPSGAAIESRLRRLSEETGMDVRGAIDPVGDRYDKKKKIDDDDEDDKFYRRRV